MLVSPIVATARTVRMLTSVCREEPVEIMPDNVLARVLHQEGEISIALQSQIRDMAVFEERG